MKNEKATAVALVSEGKTNVSGLEARPMNPLNRRLLARERRRLARKAAEVKWGQ